MTYKINNDNATRKEVEKTINEEGTLELLEKWAKGIFNSGGQELLAKINDEINVSILP